jgi:2,6-dihydroxypseudooxynicotine hydrolase
MKAIACLDLALPHLDPPGVRVAIPYEGKTLAGTLRLPRVPKNTKPPAFDGPGQGEAEYDFPIRHDYENVVAPVIDWVKANVKDVDADRIGIWGISLGGYYAPRTVAFEKRIRAAVANCGPYNWGALCHSKTDAEAKQKAFTLNMEGVAAKIECPLLVIAAGLDRLCPPEDAERLARETKGGKTELLLVEDGNHVAHNRFYKYRGKSADWMARQLGA